MHKAIRLAIAISAGALSACVPADRAYREVSGPATLAVMSPLGVSMNIAIEEGGRYFSGPDFDRLYITEDETNE